MTPTEIKRAVEKRLGTRLSPPAWAYLDSMGLVANVALGARPLDDLIRYARRFVRIELALEGPPTPSNSRLATETLGARLEAISALLVETASDEDYVKAVRAMLGAPVDWADLESWIASRAAADGPATTWVEVPLPEGHGVTLSMRGCRVDPSLEVRDADGFHSRYLSFVLPRQDFVRRVRTARGGLLEEVRYASSRLSLAYGWNEAQAATWLLTDIPPAYCSDDRSCRPSIGSPGDGEDRPGDRSCHCRGRRRDVLPPCS